MIGFQVIFISSRKIVLEMEEEGTYFTDSPYEVYLDGKKRMDSNKMVQTVAGLNPDTEYRVAVKRGDEVSEEKTIRTDYEFVTLNVKDFGAKGDGVQDDTIFIQAAINCCPKNSRVYLPKGVYKTSALFLKSDITIDIDDEAVISAFTEREKFPILPGLIDSYDEKSEYNLGTWEGNPLEMFASILTGINVSNVVITGGGTLDGNASYDNWWEGEGR